MNEQEKHHQAKDLEKIFQEVRDHEAEFEHPHSVDLTTETNANQPKIDVLNLPPRREVHETDEKRIKLKLSKSFWRLIIVMIILLIIAFFVIYDLLFAEQSIVFNFFIHTLSKKAVLFS